MKKIIFNKSIFTPEETFYIGKQVVLSLESINSVDENLQKGINELRKENKKLTEKLDVDSLNPYTKQLNEYNDLIEELFIKGSYNIKSYKYWAFEKKKKEAAENLLDIYNRHNNNIENYNYFDRGLMLDSLINEMSKPKIQKYLTLLELNSWFKELIQSKNNFTTTFNLKSAYKYEKEYFDRKEAQKPVLDNLEIIIGYLNTSVMFKTEDSEWLTIYSSIEKIIRQTTQVAHVRKSDYRNKSTNE